MATRIDLFRKNTTTIPGRKLSQNDNRQIGRLPLPAAVYSRFAAVILRLYLEMDNTRYITAQQSSTRERERGGTTSIVFCVALLVFAVFFFSIFFRSFHNIPPVPYNLKPLSALPGLSLTAQAVLPPLPSLGDTANHLPSSPSVIVTNITEVWPRGSGGLTSQKTHTIAAGLNDTPSHFVCTSLWQITMAGDAT